MTTARLPQHDDALPRVPAARFTSPVLVDLRTAWTLERDLAVGPGTRHDAWCAGHGWLLDAGLDAPLEPLLHASALGASPGAPSFYPFATLDGPAAARLLDLLPEASLDTERQHDGPSLGAVLRAVAAHPDRLLAHGYVVGPGRCDERVTVTGVLARTDRELDVRAAGGRAELLRSVRALGVDDMDGEPQEVTPWWGFGFPDERTAPGAGPEHWYRIWWD